jgi:hypothetical protein
MTTPPPFPPTCRSAAAQHTIGGMRIEHCIVLSCFFFGGVLFFELPSSHVSVLPQHMFAHLVLLFGQDALPHSTEDRCGKGWEDEICWGSGGRG